MVPITCQLPIDICNSIYLSSFLSVGLSVYLYFTISVCRLGINTRDPEIPGSRDPAVFSSGKIPENLYIFPGNPGLFSNMCKQKIYD